LRRYSEPPSRPPGEEGEDEEDEDGEPKPPPIEPDFGLSGKLAAETNTVNGVTLAGGVLTTTTRQEPLYPRKWVVPV